MVVFMFTDYHLHWQVRRYLPDYAVFDIVYGGLTLFNLCPSGSAKSEGEFCILSQRGYGLGVVQWIISGLYRVVESKRSSYTRLPSRW